MIKNLFSGFKLIVMVIITAFLFGTFAPTGVNSFFYAISLTIRSIIITLLPIAIFSFLTSGVLSTGKQIGKLFYFLVPTFLISSPLSVIYSYAVSFKITKAISGLSSTNIENKNAALKPMWNSEPITIISNNWVLLASILFGIFAVFQKEKHIVRTIIINLNSFVSNFFSKHFNRIIPFFIFGLFIQICYDGMLSLLFGKYIYFFVFYTFSAIFYTFLLGLIAFKFKVSECIEFFKKTMGAYIVAFTSMSSMISMPTMMVMMDSVTKNKKVKNVAFPMLVNIHNIADNILIPMLLMLVMYQFNYDVSFNSQLSFAISYLIIKLSGVCIPGGTAMLILPILISKMNFDDSMIAVFTACYMILDPLLTAINTACTGVISHLVADNLVSSNKNEYSENAEIIN